KKSPQKPKQPEPNVRLLVFQAQSLAIHREKQPRRLPGTPAISAEGPQDGREIMGVKDSGCGVWGGFVDFDTGRFAQVTGRCCANRALAAVIDRGYKERDNVGRTGRSDANPECSQTAGTGCL
ncbi:MAG: hypothetical protein ACKPJD_07045, partial [Planctomycetaceae bacterium]